MQKKRARSWRRYDGIRSSIRHIRQLLPIVMKEIGRRYQDRPDLVLASWPAVIGSKLAPMARAVSFCEGILVVKVNNSTLHSLLSQNDKPRLIKNLRERFPQTMIKTIVFRLG